jgi:hypothetical protein
MPALTVHNAEIRTATVEVKTLAMSGKQVTLAVFRQLREQTLINDDGSLNGQPWGSVNYHADKCADAAEHLHVVWQLGSDLFRDRVSLDVTYPRWIEAESATAWVDAKVREEATGMLVGWKPMAEEFTRPFQGVSVRMVMSDEAQKVTFARGHLDDMRRDVAIHGSSHSVYAVVARRSPRPAASGLAAARRLAHALKVPLSEELSATEDLFEKALAVLPTTPLVEAEARLIAEVRVEAERRRRHRDARAGIADLPQLFIAV